MLTFHDTNIQLKLEKTDGITIKKLNFTQQIKNVPNFKFFTMKKAFLTTYKPKLRLC